MIRVEPDFEYAKIQFSNLSEYSFGEICAPEFNLSALMQITDRRWMVSENEQPLFYLGVVHMSLLGSPPEVWILVTRNLHSKVKVLIQLKTLFEVLQKMYKTLHVRILKNYSKGIRFAKFFGFKKYTSDGDYYIYKLEA